MSDLELLIKKVNAFRDERNWRQFHNPKDVALSLVLEAAEVLEHFQWKTPAEIAAHVKTHKADLAKELCDVLSWVLILSHDLEIDLVKAYDEKLRQDGRKYPVAKAKGSSRKYTDL